MLHIPENGEFRHLMPEIPFLKLAFNISFAFILSSGIRTAPIFWSRLFPDVPREPLQSCGNVVVDVHERELRFFHELSHDSVQNYILFSPFFFLFVATVDCIVTERVVGTLRANEWMYMWTVRAGGGFSMWTNGNFARVTFSLHSLLCCDVTCASTRSQLFAKLSSFVKYQVYF